MVIIKLVSFDKKLNFEISAVYVLFTYHSIIFLLLIRVLEMSVIKNKIYMTKKNNQSIIKWIFLFVKYSTITVLYASIKKTNCSIRINEYLSFVKYSKLKVLELFPVKDISTLLTALTKNKNYTPYILLHSNCFKTKCQI